MGIHHRFHEHDELGPVDEDDEIDEMDYQAMVAAKAEALGVPGNTKLARYVLDLEYKLENLNRVLDIIGERLGIVLYI